jgi:Ulp1 family protease
LGNSRKRAADVLKQYLCDEAGVAKENREAVRTDPTNPVFVTIPNPKTPLQPNFCDCGVYVIETIEKMLTKFELYRDYLLVIFCD